MGGLPPMRASRGCILAPNQGVPWAMGHGTSELRIPLGAMGTTGVSPRPMAPLLGGGDALSRGSAGEYPPTVPLGISSPDGPPDLEARLCITPRVLGVDLLGVTIPILPICTSHIVDSFLPIACSRLQSSILLKIRPPEELLHQTCRAFRAESDSSTLEVPRGF